MFLPMIWISCIRLSKKNLSEKILPNYSLFHFFILAFRSFNYYWNLYILGSSPPLNSSHDIFIFSSKWKCSIQTYSNLKGFLNWDPISLHISSIGQWPNPILGNVAQWISLSRPIMDYVTKKWSSMDAICLSPILLLFQLNHPSPTMISTRPKSSMVFVKASLPSSILHLPPFFTSNEAMRLKCPPTTQWKFSNYSLIILREWRNSLFSPAWWGPYTFITIPEIGNPTTLNSTERE